MVSLCQGARNRPCSNQSVSPACPPSDSIHHYSLPFSPDPVHVCHPNLISCAVTSIPALGNSHPNPDSDVPQTFVPVAAPCGPSACRCDSEELIVSPSQVKTLTLPCLWSTLLRLLHPLQAGHKRIS